MATNEENPGRFGEIRQAAQPDIEKLRQLLRAEQVYTEKLSRQLRIITGSRLWRAAQWLRRLSGYVPYVPDFERPGATAGAALAGTMAEVFGAIYADNLWGSEVSRSGTGSDLEQTAAIREALPALLRELNARTMLDIPCGDFHWMSTLQLAIDYTGADVVPDLIAANSAHHAGERRRFRVLDIANDTLPRVDLIFCRDLLVHFSFDDALRAIANLKRSGATYLLTTTFTNRSANVDITTGQWRALNLQLPPFNFPTPRRLINEKCTEWTSDWADKSLGLWLLSEL